MDECNPFKMSDMDQYLYGIYWVSTTLMSVGYGDISPAYNVNLERLYAIGVQVVNCSMNSQVLQYDFCWQSV